MLQELMHLNLAIGILSQGLDRDHPAIAYTIERMDNARADFALFEKDGTEPTPEYFQELNILQNKHARELALAKKIV